MSKTNFKKNFGIICLCAILLVVSIFATACENAGSTKEGEEITKEKLLEANNTSKLLDQYQTITAKSTSTNKSGIKTVNYMSYHKDINGNIVQQDESRRINGEFEYSSAHFDGIVVNLWPSPAVTFVITDDWNATAINQFNPFSKNGSYEIIGDIKIENDKIVVKTSKLVVNETVTDTNYFNKDTYLIEKIESTATNEAGEITFQSVEEYFYGKQIINHSTAYQVFSLAHVGLSKLTVNYVDTNESKVYYINRNAMIFNAVSYDDLDAQYKIYSNSECTEEISMGTVFGEIEELWIKKAAE